MIKHDVKTMSKQFITKLYSFNKIKVKENIILELLTRVKVLRTLINIIFNVVNMIKIVILEYS